MAFPVVSTRLTYAPAAALIHLESLKMLLQDDASAYPADTPDYKEYLLDSNAILLQHITGLIKYHSM